MYGMINRAVQEYFIEHHGPAVWQDIETQAATGVRSFALMEQYPDEITYALVATGAKVLGWDIDQVLRAIGRYWVAFAVRSGYGEFLRSAGRTVAEILDGLDALHLRIALLFPRLRQPSFWCTDNDGRSLILHYRSSREGLAPMVVGLVEGLGDMLSAPLEVRQIVDRGKGADHDEFLVTFGAA